MSVIELRSVEVDRGWRRGRSWRRQRSLAYGKGIMNNGCHLGWVAMTADMHVECRAVLPQQVIVDGGNLKPAFDQF